MTALEFIPSETWFFTSVFRKNLDAKVYELANKLYHIRHNKIMGELKSFAVIIHPVVRKHHVVIIYFLTWAELFGMYCSECTYNDVPY